MMIVVVSPKCNRIKLTKHAAQSKSKPKSADSEERSGGACAIGGARGTPPIVAVSSDPTARDAAAGIVENVVAAAGMVDRQDRNARSTAAPAQKADQQVQPIERMARTVACNSRSRNATRFVSDGLAYLRQR